MYCLQDIWRREYWSLSIMAVTFVCPSYTSLRHVCPSITSIMSVTWRPLCPSVCTVCLIHQFMFVMFVRYIHQMLWISIGTWNATSNSVSIIKFLLFENPSEKVREQSKGKTEQKYIIVLNKTLFTTVWNAKHEKVLTWHLILCVNSFAFTC